MADVAANLKDWSTTPSSNSPSDATTIGAGLADNFQQTQATVRQDLASKGADIASATTTDLGAVAGHQHDITGTTTITSFGTVAAGIWKIIKFEGALTLTHNATSLILPGAANITTADGDVAVMVSEGSGNWRCASYSRANGKSAADITLAAEQASTSGTSIDFTGIPSGVKRITVMFKGVSTNGTDPLLIQIGDSGGIEASGYLGSSVTLTNAAGIGGSNYTTGFGFESGAAANVFHGALVLSLENASAFSWTANGQIARSNSATIALSAGSKSTSAELDRVRITTVNGTDAFDAGAISISYE